MNNLHFKTSHSEPVLLGTIKANQINNAIVKDYLMNNGSVGRNTASKIINYNNVVNSNQATNNSVNSYNTNSNTTSISTNNNNGNNNNVSTSRRSPIKRHQSFQQFSTYYHPQQNAPSLPSPLTMPNYIRNSATQHENSQSLDVSASQSFNNPGFCVRFAVNGISKFSKGSSTPPMNRNIQAGDFGDDAGMIAENSRCIVIGLADGAGGNRSIGIDPQKFSRSLLGYCVEIIKNEEVMPNQMARLACKSIQILEAKNIDGSGTLCLLALNKHTNIMHALNIGDSGFRLIRQGQIVHKSEATMAGSSPKQLYVSDSSNYSGISFVSEQEIAQDSDIREFQVKKGDLLILSSDGMFDVMQDHAIEKVVNSHNEKDLQGIADDLLLQTMRSYVLTQRDDILIMVCRVELKK